MLRQTPDPGTCSQLFRHHKPTMSFPLRGPVGLALKLPQFGNQWLSRSEEADENSKGSESARDWLALEKKICSLNKEKGLEEARKVVQSSPAFPPCLPFSLDPMNGLLQPQWIDCISVSFLSLYRSASSRQCLSYYLISSLQAGLNWHVLQEKFLDPQLQNNSSYLLYFIMF